MRLIQPLAKRLARGVLPCGAALGPDSVSQRLSWKHSCARQLKALALLTSALSAKAELLSLICRSQEELPHIETCHLGGQQWVLTFVPVHSL